MPEMERC